LIDIDINSASRGKETEQAQNRTC